jgi:hypothetical protein
VGCDCVGLHHHADGSSRSIRLGPHVRLQRVGALTWVNGLDRALPGSAAFTVVPRTSPLVLLRLWCGANWSQLTVGAVGSVVQC